MCLYKLKKEEFEYSVEEFSKGFYDDLLYKIIEEDDNKRAKAIRCFFKIYIKLFWKYHGVYADSKDKKAVVLICKRTSKKEDFKLFFKTKIALFKSLRLISIMGLKKYIRAKKILDSMDSSWIDEFVHKDFIHIDLIVVKKEYQKQGIGSFVIKNILDYAKQNNLVVTLETQSLYNKSLYEKLGFKCIGHHSEYNLTNYFMVNEID